MSLSFRRWFLENPVVGRQLATSLTGPKLGLVFSLVTGALLITGVVTLGGSLLEARSAPTANVGWNLYQANFQVVYCLLAILLPMRVSGVLDGPRLDRCFDQLVATGVSPLKLHFGNWGLGFLYALSILLVSLPFQLFSQKLGGPSWGTMTLAYGVLALYSNVIIAATLGLGIIERERVAASLSALFFFFAGRLAYSRISSVFGEISPVRFLLRQTPNWLEEDPGLPLGSLQDPIFFFSPIPLAVYPFLLWALIALPPVILLLLGPLHRFLPGLDNFGAVVLPGDRKKSLFRTVRHALTRKVELAFFYENRPSWLAGWDFGLRTLLIVGGVVFLWGVIVGGCFNGSPRVNPSLRLDYDSASLTSLSLTGAVLFLAVLLFSDVKETVHWKEQVWRWRLPRGYLVGGCVALLAMGYFALHSWEIEKALQAAQSPQDVASGLSAARISSYRSEYLQFVGAIVFFLLNCHVWGRVLARFVSSIVWSRLAMVIAAVLGLFLPIYFYSTFDEGWLPRWLFPLGFISPVSVLVIPRQASAQLKRMGASLGMETDRAFQYFLWWQAAAMAIALFFLAWSCWKRRRRPETKESSLAKVSLLFLLGAVAASPSLRAQPQGPSPPAKSLGLEAEVIHAFEGKIFPKGANFFTLVIRNRSGSTIRGKLHLIDIFQEDLETPIPFEAPASTSTVVRWSLEERPFLLGKPVPPGNPRTLSLVLEAPEGSLSLEIPDLQEVLSGGSIAVTESGAAPSLPLSTLVPIACKPFCLPEDVRCYGGASRVLVGPVDLSRWTHGQRRALLDYVRLGGSVIFFGPIDRSMLKGAEEWEGVLQGLDEHPGEPLLHVRGVGPGRVSHLSAESLPGMPENQEASAALESKLPRSTFPLLVSGSKLLRDELRDTSSLALAFGYFVVYFILIGPAVFFGFRRKERRGALPIYILGLPLLFAGAFPLLDAVLRLRPSYAAFTRAVFLGPGAREGVVETWLEVRSSGRQKHQVSIRSNALSAFSLDEAQRPKNLSRFRTRGGGEGQRLVSLALLPSAGEEHRLEISSMPWGERQVVLLSGFALTQPIPGRAVWTKASGTLTFEAKGIPVETASGEACLLLLDLPEAGQYLLEDLDAGSARWAEGAVSGDLTLSADSQRHYDLASFPIFQERLRLGLPSGSGPRVFLVFEAPNLPGEIESADLSFEREVIDEEPRKGGRKRRIVDTFEKGGKTFRSFRHTAIFQELPLEIR